MVNIGLWHLLHLRVGSYFTQRDNSYPKGVLFSLPELELSLLLHLMSMFYLPC